MKAFVIKNKEGKYFQWLFNDEPDWEDKLYNSFMHYSKEDAEKSIIQWQLENCKVVEITITEGDLEKELEYYFGLTQAQITEIDELKQRLAEKNEEIERLHKYLELDWAMTPQRVDGKTWTKRKIIEDWEKQIRHQVCDEIRHNFYIGKDSYCDKEGKEIITYHINNFILDKIEEGE